MKEKERISVLFTYHTPEKIVQKKSCEKIKKYLTRLQKEKSCELVIDYYEEWDDHGTRFCFDFRKMKISGTISVRNNSVIIDVTTEFQKNLVGLLVSEGIIRNNLIRIFDRIFLPTKKKSLKNPLF